MSEKTTLYWTGDYTELHAVVRPLIHGNWRFDIYGGTVSGDYLWKDTGVTSYGTCGSRDRAVRKAHKRMNKIVKRYARLRLEPVVVKFGHQR